MNWLTAAIKPEKTKVSKKERKQKKEDFIIDSYHWFYWYIGDILFISNSNLYQSYLLHGHIIVHSYIIMRAHHTFIDYCTFSLGYLSTH